ncbi:MAG: ElyC/SanA/YdcF family protein [Chloroflexota bacterium]|nr:ElyC/SanA/YdcF family protein [Chloroflexota bacterium]
MTDHSQHAQCGGTLWRLLFCGAVACAFLAAVPVFLRWWTDHRYRGYTHTVEDAPARDVAIVFGAGVWPDGTLSPILADRVQTAMRLYEAGKVRKLLMTGDNQRADYNEPAHMRDYALAQGVPSEDIVLDYAGRRTYDSCYRARHIFCVSEAILVTQSYHLDRALFTARSLGIDAVGVAADRRDYVHIEGYWWRELLATTLAWWEVKIARPKPILGEKEPIFGPSS